MLGGLIVHLLYCSVYTWKIKKMCWQQTLLQEKEYSFWTTVHNQQAIGLRHLILLCKFAKLQGVHQHNIPCCILRIQSIKFVIQAIQHRENSTLNSRRHTHQFTVQVKQFILLNSQLGLIYCTYSLLISVRPEANRLEKIQTCVPLIELSTSFQWAETALIMQQFKQVSW